MVVRGRERDRVSRGLLSPELVSLSSDQLIASLSQQGWMRPRQRMERQQLIVSEQEAVDLSFSQYCTSISDKYSSMHDELGRALRVIYHFVPASLL